VRIFDKQCHFVGKKREQDSLRSHFFIDPRSLSPNKATRRLAWQALELSEMRRALLKIVTLGAFTVAVPALLADSFPSSGPVVPGSQAALQFGMAYAPAQAPLPVKQAIWAGNQLQKKRYRYGGGHRSFIDKGYDCSGTVSYVLAAAGLVRSPMHSAEFRSFGNRGKGKWITVYSRRGHTFAVIAGLRLDTTEWNETRPNRHWAPRWRLTYRNPRGFAVRHPVGL
jgi:hypothetical protein